MTSADGALAVIVASADSSTTAVAIVGTALLAYALVSRRLAGSFVSSAMVFVVAGLFLGTDGLGVVDEVDAGSVRLLAEVTLALVLFTDAASLDTRALRHEAQIPTRLLLVGLPLTIVAGTLVGLPLFSELGVFELLVLAVVLAPTDAALGASVVADERLPSSLRQGLNVESGLNDGICVPLLFGAIALAEIDAAPAFEGEIVTDLLTELAIAVAIGASVAAVAAIGLRASSRRGWITPAWLQIVPLATVAIAYALTVEAGGSGFVASFVGGLVYGGLAGAAGAGSVRLAEELGDVLSAVTFFVFGAVVLDATILDLDAASVVYALLSLTVVRMLPVALSLIGTGAAPPTVAFAGWFGPRGLASIVFALIVVEEAALPGTALVVQVTMLTVLLSVFAHGASAALLTDRYVRWAAARGR